MRTTLTKSKLEANRLNAKKLLLKPDLEPSPPLARILGTLLGDGCVSTWIISKRSLHHYAPFTVYHISLTAKDLDFVETFRNDLLEIGLRPHLNFATSNQCYHCRALSKIFVCWYKSLTIDAIFKMFSDDLFYPFLAGFIDSEGWLVPQRNQRGRVIGLQFFLGNTNLNLIQYLYHKLISLDFHPSWRHCPPSRVGYKDSYIVYLNRKGEIKKLLLACSPSIPRKQWRDEYDYLREKLL